MIIAKRVPNRSIKTPVGRGETVLPRAWAVITWAASPMDTPKASGMTNMVGMIMPWPKLIMKEVLYKLMMLRAVEFSLIFILLCGWPGEIAAGRQPPLG